MGDVQEGDPLRKMSINFIFFNILKYIKIKVTGVKNGFTVLPNKKITQKPMLDHLKRVREKKERN